MKKLETPPTLRKPDLSELPKSREAIQKLNEFDKANIVEGYTLTIIPANDDKFKIFAEINIDNSRLWNLVKTFVIQFAEEISFIFNYIDEDPYYGEYEDKYSVINKIESFQTELTQDCFLDFGFITQSDSYLEEVFIDSTKYLKYWGNDEIKFKEVMNRFNLIEIRDLRFIDEFPNVKEPLSNFREDVIKTKALIEKFKILFNSNIE